MSDPTEGHDLSGPWLAVLSGNGGYLITLDDLFEHSPVEIAVVRRSALPKDDGNGERRRPATYSVEDVLFEVDDFDDDEDVAFRWALARRIAHLLNVDDRRVAGVEARRAGRALAAQPETAARIDAFLSDPSTGVRRERPTRRAENGENR